MKIIVVDDEKIALQGLEKSVREVLPEAVIYSASKEEDALEIMKNNNCDVAFLDICLRGSVHGVELARELKRYNPHINIIFTTGYTEYMMDAFKLHVSGYLIKPVTAEKIKKEIEDLRYPVKINTDKRMRVQCFGNFDVFVDGSPIQFGYSKTKELFAYLVDRRGATVSGNELCAVLWEDDCRKEATKAYLRNLYADLKKTFARLGVEDALVKGWGTYAVKPDSFWCDRYEFERGNAAVINSFQNEYMTQYSWAEFGIGTIKKL